MTSYSKKMTDCFFVLISLSLLFSDSALAQFDGTVEDSPKFRSQREEMVRDQITARGVKDPGVVAAMQGVLRHRFVPRSMHRNAYADRPLPIGEGQTISQPYIVALMTELLKLTGTEKVLEIGTGSGYQAALLSKTTRETYTIEIKEMLCHRATQLLTQYGYDNIHTRCGDGYFGWPDKAPFDAIMITAAVDHIPPPLIKQLKVGGRLVLPLGNPFVFQNLVRVTKEQHDVIVENITGVLFVPMTGHALKSR